MMKELTLDDVFIYKTMERPAYGPFTPGQIVRIEGHGVLNQQIGIVNQWPGLPLGLVPVWVPAFPATFYWAIPTHSLKHVRADMGRRL